jgi:hypothetical protein
VENTRTLSDILTDLEHTLSIEASALRSLDRQGIDAAASRKLDLDAELHATSLDALSEDDRPRVERIQRIALSNQLLLVHARACLQGVLSLATGLDLGPAYPASPPSRSAPAPVRLDVRG